MTPSEPAPQALFTPEEDLAEPSSGGTPLPTQGKGVDLSRHVVSAHLPLRRRLKAGTRKGSRPHSNSCSRSCPALVRAFA